MAILVDASQILIAAASIGFNNEKENLTESIIRNIFLHSIKNIKNRYTKNYGELILAFDGKNNWRKQVYPYYKFKRADARKESPMDWNLIFGTLNKMYDEMYQYFSYTSIKVEGAEADDIISIMVKYINEKQSNDLFKEKTEKLLIVSSDKDFMQLQHYKNVTQWSHIQKKILKDENPLYSRYEKIIKGDAGDGIVNIFSPDNCFVDGIRQTPATKKKIEPIITSLMETGNLPVNISDELRNNFFRNKMLIDLVDIQLPEHIKDNIISEYYTSKENSSGRGNGNLMMYFSQYKLKNLMNEIHKF